ncbi:folate receptor gamma-like protein, partial [Leptotrombidium deliense]
CKPWQENSCCTEETSALTHAFQNQYNFDLNACESQVNRKLSEECRKHFIRDLCFYECEPHIGLWVVKVKRKIAKERFFEVPLCASSCEQWWNACRDQFTCAYNWQTDFIWVNGVNRCNTTCKQFKEMYKNSVDFCESVFDHSWKYTDDSKPCMRISFDNDSENNNRNVAEYYVDRELALINSCVYITSSRLIIVALVSLVILNNNFIVF